MCFALAPATAGFQSTPPVKAATRGCRPSRKLDSISIHAAREGGDHTPTFKRLIIGEFQSTPPVKAATLRAALCALQGHISIHAAREGGDAPPSLPNTSFRLISIHAAREGGDKLISYRALPRTGFQSTPPVKAATRPQAQLSFRIVFQSTPPVKAATYRCSSRTRRRHISIHAAREGGDAPSLDISKPILTFQSTPPVKAATFLKKRFRNKSIFQSTPPVKAAT